MKDFDYSMVDLKLIDMCKAVTDLYYEECEQVLTEVLMNMPDYGRVYDNLLIAIKNHYYFANMKDLRDYLRGE